LGEEGNEISEDEADKLIIFDEKTGNPKIIKSVIGVIHIKIQDYLNPRINNGR